MNPRSIDCEADTLTTTPSHQRDITIPLPESRLRSAPLTLDLTFPFLSQRRQRARGYLSELRSATCPEKSHSSFCSPFSPAEFLAAASNLSSSTATGPEKVAYPMLKHLSRSGMDFLLHIFNLSWSLHSFLFIWKTSFIIPIHKMGMPLDSLLPSSLSLFPGLRIPFFSSGRHLLYSHP